MCMRLRASAASGGRHLQLLVTTCSGDVKICQMVVACKMVGWEVLSARWLQMLMMEAKRPQTVI